MSEKILIIGPSWVGDMIMAQALFRHLRALHPDAQIDVAAPKWCLDVVKRMPEIHEGIALPLAHGEFGLLKRYRIGKSMRAKKYDHAYVLPNSLKSALIPFFARIPVRTGWLGEMRYRVLNDARKLDKDHYPLMVQRFVALAYPKGSEANTDLNRYPLLDIPTADTQAAVKKHGLTVKKDQPILAIAPGAAFGNAKRWPAEYVVQVANAKIQQGWKVWLLGSPDDTPVLEEIHAATNNQAVILGGQVSLAEKLDLLALSSIVISNDSGLLHVGAALDKPVIAIYGSTTPTFTPPLTEKGMILQVDNLACRPCFQRSCPLTGTAELKCLKDIAPQQVLNSITHLTEVA